MSFVMMHVRTVPERGCFLLPGDTSGTGNGYVSVWSLDCVDLHVHFLKFDDEVGRSFRVSD